MAATPDAGRSKHEAPSGVLVVRRGQFDLVDWLAKHAMSYELAEHNGRDVFKLAACPFNAEHANGAAAVIRDSDGKLGFKCFHDSCC